MPELVDVSRLTCLHAICRSIQRCSSWTSRVRFLFRLPSSSFLWLTPDLLSFIPAFYALGLRFPAVRNLPPVQKGYLGLVAALGAGATKSVDPAAPLRGDDRLMRIES